MKPGAAGPGSAQTAELTYTGEAEDAVLAAGIADERLDPGVLEAAIREALAAWAAAVEEGAAEECAAWAGTAWAGTAWAGTAWAGTAGAGTAGAGTAGGPADREAGGPAVAPALLRPGGPGARTRLVIRGPRIEKIEFWRLEAAAGWVAARLIVVVHGARCIVDRDTGEPVSGDLAVMTRFHQFWDMVRGDLATGSWRLEPRSRRDDRDYADQPESRFTAGRETVPQYRERTGAAAPPPAAGPEPGAPGEAAPAAPAEPQPGAPGEPGPIRRHQISCGFFEHDVYTGGGADITVRLAAAPSWNDAVQLLLPAIFASLTRSTGLSDWRPSISSIDVRELLD